VAVWAEVSPAGIISGVIVVSDEVATGVSALDVAASVVVAAVVAAAAVVSLAVDLAVFSDTEAVVLCVFAGELLLAAVLFEDAKGLSPPLRLASFSAEIVSP